MRRSSLKLLIAGVVTALAVPAGLLATSPAASAAGWTPFSGGTSQCDASQSPITFGSQSNLSVGCQTAAADLSSDPVITDGPNTRYHNGEVMVYTTCSWAPGSPNVSCGSAGVTAPAFTTANQGLFLN